MFKKIGVIGYGAFSREFLCNVKQPFDIFFYNNYKNFELEEIEKYYNCNCFDISKFDYNKYKALITIVDCDERKQITDDLSNKTEYVSYIDKHAILMDPNNIQIGKGSIICAGTILTTNIKLGDFTQLNILTTIGHDAVMGNYCTTAPSVNISGNCVIGNNVYFGNNSSVKEKITITDDVIIGLNSGVVKNISIKGTYIGTPAIKIK
jgi:sugar O-acyltransferase (sialic acid O-acetyltransferase NeuD family)